MQTTWAITTITITTCTTWCSTHQPTLRPQAASKTRSSPVRPMKKRFSWSTLKRVQPSRSDSPRTSTCSPTMSTASTVLDNWARTAAAPDVCIHQGLCFPTPTTAKASTRSTSALCHRITSCHCRRRTLTCSTNSSHHSSLRMISNNNINNQQPLSINRSWRSVSTKACQTSTTSWACTVSYRPSSETIKLGRHNWSRSLKKVTNLHQMKAAHQVMVTAQDRAPLQTTKGLLVQSHPTPRANQATHLSARARSQKASRWETLAEL